VCQCWHARNHHAPTGGLFGRHGARLIKDGRKTRSPLMRNARDGAQVFVDGAKVIIGHVRENGPRHNLQKRGIEWSGRRRSKATFRS
jgi:hypothetical protein